MNESVRLIKFEHFRGLPANEFKLKGKSLVLFGTNGKGKSAFVDGIEFVFSGQISRFVGANTGSISHDDAVKNVKTGGDPRVVLALSPSNGEISRKLSSDSIEISEKQAAKDFLEHHPNVDSFVLRRDKILDFVRSRDGDRYQQFVQLLGITRLDRLQRSFVDAERQAKTVADRARTEYQTKLAVFTDTSLGVVPANLAQALAQIAKAAEAFDLTKIEKWEDLESRLQLLKAKRPHANRERIDAITRALVSIEGPLPTVSDDDVKEVNHLRLKITELASSSVDAPRSRIIEEGRSYLAQYKDETHCPLCESRFEQPADVLLARLKDRATALQELRSARSNRTAALNRIGQFALSVAQQLEKDLAHSDLLDATALACLSNARAKALSIIQLLTRADIEGFSEDVAIPNELQVITEVRKAVAVALRRQNDELIPPDSTQLEAAIALLERGIASWQNVEKAESEVAASAEVLRRTTIARECFSTAREAAIQQVFTKISDKVLEYYEALHNFDDGCEASECTALELKPTSRAATGGLRLAIQFLGLVNSKDPRAFLSEGHLDSLGLCLFLAAVRIFNPPGTLLVLDDVLTSIDKEHRRRVGELLFTEFKDYQIILTTHDEHWNELLQSSARAMGLQSQWQHIHINGWTADSGPALSVSDSSWDFINENLTEANYRNLGGPFRVVLEDFLSRTAAKNGTKVRFKSDGKYTVGDFVNAGIAAELLKLLIKGAPADEAQIQRDLARVLGQGDLINFLSHNNPGRLEVTFDQARDFVSSLRSLLARCEKHGLIKGK